MDAGNAKDLCIYDDDWKARANQAIATSRLQRQALLTARREKLNLARETLHIHAAHLRKNDPEGLQRLCTRIADYYRAHGRLLQLAKRLGQRLDRHSAHATKLR